MKTESNVGFQSNINVISKDGIRDHVFRKNVWDPESLNILKEKGYYLTPLQKELCKSSIPCMYAEGKCTFGIYYEKGRNILVNTCENVNCYRYKRCSSESIYRKVSFPDYITPPAEIKPPDDLALIGVVHVPGTYPKDLR